MEACYTIHSPEYHVKLLSELHVLQQQGVLCDVILAAEDGQVMAHKVVLMAASKYFRDKLSSVISATASKICLKGISIVELSNLVKYMYTGKLLVAINTMDVILEIAEILELNGVLQDYAEILNSEQRKDGSGSKHSHVLLPAPPQLGEVNTAMKPLEGISDAAIHEKDDHLSQTKEASIKHTQSSQKSTSEATKPCKDQKATNYSTASPVEYCQGDDTTSEPAEINTVNASLHDYGFEFNTYDRQYMDVSVGCQSPVKNSNLPNLPQLTYMSFASSVADEQAQHQDLLTVAIETLSDTSQKMGNHFKLCNVESAVPVVNEENTQLVSISGLHRSQLATGIIDTIVEPFENGKTNTRTVTLSAGSINNELGGKTDVYTVAIDPSTIKEPLKMPRPRKKKTEKEKQAEKTADMYRKKKAEILHGSQLPVTNSPSKFENTDKHGYLLVGQNLVLNRTDNILAEKLDNRFDKIHEFKTECFVPRVVVNSSSESEDLLVNKEYDVDHTTNMSKFVIHVKSKVGDYFESETPVPAYPEQTDFCQVVNFDRDEENAKNRETVADDNAILKTVDSDTENRIKEKQDHFANSIAFAEHEVESSKECQKQKHNAEGVMTLRSARAHMKGKEPNIKALDISELALSENKMKENINALTKQQLKEMKKEDADVSLEINRSSATKRKTRLPRKLPVSDDENNDMSDLRGTVPSSKTRKLCRNDDSIINNEQDNDDESSKARDVKHKKNKIFDTEGDDDMTCDNNEQDLCDIEEKKTRIDQLNAHRFARQRLISMTKSGKDESWNYSDREDKLNKVRGKYGFQKEMLPEVRLKKQTLQEMFEMARDIFSSVSNISQATKTDTCVELTNNVDRDVATKGCAVTKCMPGHAENFIDTDTINCASSLKKTKVPQCNSSDYFQIVCGSSEPSSNACALDLGVDKTLNSFDGNSCMYLGRKMKLDGTTLPDVSNFDCQEETNQDQSFYEGVAGDEMVDDEMVDDGQKVETDDVCQQQLDDASYECMMCDFISSSPKVLIGHVKEHVGCGDDIPCKKCCKMFKAIRDLKKHYVIHTDKKYTCAYCDYSTSLKNSLRVHMKLKHSSESDLFSCKFCTYQTPLARNLRKHVFAAHYLIVVTKQTKNCLKYGHFEEGTIITVDGMVFDPNCMELPKVLKNNFPKIITEKEMVREERKHRSPEKTLDKEEKKREKRPRIALNKLPNEEFTKELLKRHEEYLKKPVEDKAFMCSNIALATEQPSFPQASPNVRNTKANKLYNMEKIQHSFIHLPVHSVQCDSGNSPDSQTNNTGGMHNVGNEVEVEDTEDPVEVVIEDGYNANTMILSLPENGNENGEQMIMLNKNGQKSLIRTKDFYASLNADEEDLETSQTLGVISALLEAGEQIEIREQEEIVEIQNV